MCAVSSAKHVLTAAFLALVVASNMRAQGGISRLTTIRGGETVDLVISPTGRHVLRATPDRLELIGLHPEGKNSRRGTLTKGGLNFGLNWAACSNRVAWTRADRGLSNPTIWSSQIYEGRGATVARPQRVSLGMGESPSLSNDGKWIAYASIDSITSTNRTLVVVPSQGGSERTIARLRSRPEAIYWSSDGRSLLVAGVSPDERHAALTRYSLDRAAPVVLSRDSAWVAGSSGGGRFFILVPMRGFAASGDVVKVINQDGAVIGTVPLIQGRRIQYAGLFRGSSLVLVSHEQHFGITTQSIENSKPRELPIVGESNLAPKYSPDGRRMLFTIRDQGSTHLASINVDGTGLQEWKLATVRPDDWGARWSPDGRSIAFESPDRRKLSLLDSRTGSVRTVLEDSRGLGAFYWILRGKELAVFTSRGLARLNLSGTSHIVVPARTLQASRGAGTALDEAALLRSDSALTLISFTGAPNREMMKLPLITTSTAAVSGDQTHVAVYMRDTAANTIELFNISSMSRREIRLPFKISKHAHEPAFTKGDSSLLIIAETQPNETGRVVLVPLHGRRPLEIANTHAFGNGASISASPDGRSIAYTRLSSHSTTLELLDLRKVLRVNSGTMKAATPGC
jgi:Tol biopolymer transport system component